MVLCDAVTLTIHLILIDGRGIVMDYLCAKFGDFYFSCFGFIVRTDRQTDRQNYTQTAMIVSNNMHLVIIQRNYKKTSYRYYFS